MFEEVQAGPTSTTNHERERPSSIAAPRARSGDLDVKRVVDVVGGVLALLYFAPVMIIVYFILFVTGGQPIFAHRRIGRNGQLFHCYKFRSMVKNANGVLADYLNWNAAAREEWNRTFKLARDPRVTRFGMFLRRTSLDELPQLINVLKGEMSLVGPRPIVPGEIPRYSSRIESYYRCRPGITGLWQVNGRNHVDYRRRVCFDTLYARRQSVWLDLRIMFRTVWVVLVGRGAY